MDLLEIILITTTIFILPKMEVETYSFMMEDSELFNSKQLNQGIFTIQLSMLISLWVGLLI